MNFFKSMATAILFTVVTALSVNATPSGSDINNALRETVQELLKKPKIERSVDENVRISFFVTTDGEIVVLKTDSRTKVLDSFIKSRLNYQKTEMEGVEANRVYNMKVHFKIQ